MTTSPATLLANNLQRSAAEHPTSDGSVTTLNQLGQKEKKLLHRLRDNMIARALAPWKEDARQRIPIRLEPGVTGPWSAPVTLSPEAGAKRTRRSLRLRGAYFTSAALVAGQNREI